METKKQPNLFYWFMALFLVFLFSQYLSSYNNTADIPYSEFQSQLKGNNIIEVVVDDHYIRGTFKKPIFGNKKLFITAKMEDDLAKRFDETNIKYSRVLSSTFLTSLLSMLLPVIIFFAIWFYVGNKMTGKDGFGGGLLSIGKSKAKIYIETDVNTSFADVAGVDEAKAELMEIVEFLKNPADHGRLGAKMPKGVLLVGPPGTGKTLLAKAVAGEAKVPFFSISGSEFVEMFVGVGAARVRDLFEQARQKAPCIIFIDELDALGRSRSISPLTGSHDEKEQTLNQLLAELDGFDTKAGVILLAATNRPEILDPALLRAGRFDRQILVDRPDKSGRVEILKVHIKKIKLAANVVLDDIASMTPGFTGADIANLVNEAALFATRRGAQEINIDDFTSAIERIVAGLERKNRLLNPTERKVVSYHEMGHALIAILTPGYDKVHKVSIIPRGIGSLGYTIQRPTEDRYLMTKEELLNKIVVLLGGRASEMLIFNRTSTGATDDISRATDIARSIVTRYGMSDKLGAIAYETEPSSFLGSIAFSYEKKLYSEQTAHEIDDEIKKIIDDAIKKAKIILETNRMVLERGAELLLKKETLTEDELVDLFKPEKSRSPRQISIY